MSEQTMQCHPVRITVVKKLFHEDMVREHTAQPEKWNPCGHFEVGDVFMVDGGRPWDMPEGFCGWAWADMQKIVHGMARGGNKEFVTCCTDGYRPVVFLLEQL